MRPFERVDFLLNIMGGNALSVGNWPVARYTAYPMTNKQPDCLKYNVSSGSFFIPKRPHDGYIMEFIFLINIAFKKVIQCNGKKNT